MLEEVNCGVGGECEDEGVIWRGEFNRRLSEGEMDVFGVIGLSCERDDIGGGVDMWGCRVKGDGENIKGKMKVGNVGEMIW